MSHSLYSLSFKNIPSKNTFRKIEEICHKKTKFLQDQISESKLAPIDVIFNSKDLADFVRLSKKASIFKKTIVLGVGGSSLGGKTLCSLRFQNKVEFMESIDPSTIKNSLLQIDLRDSFFLVISKSGETIETICQTLIIIDEMRGAKIKNFAQQFLFVTESKENSLAKIAQKIGAEIAHHPNTIGGRYSGFSITALLPAIIAGIDVKKIREGAKKIIADFLEEKPIKNQVTQSCIIQQALYLQGFTNNVIMPYIDSLKNFTDWYRQLWAESLGKNSFGSTPINSMGTVDQHSQLQLYLDGTKDKFFTFITAKKHECDFSIKDLEACQTLFGGKKLSQIVEVEQKTTIEILHRKKLPIRIFEVSKINEEVLGGLMMRMFLETILIAYCKDINPFDQPAVELRKDLAKKILKTNAKNMSLLQKISKN